MTAVLAPPDEPDRIEPPPRRRMSLAEFERLPEDPAVIRNLIDGELWERDMTVRNKTHCRVASRVVQRLQNQLDAEQVPAEAPSGEVGVVFPGSDTRVGIDVAVVAQELLDEVLEGTTLVRGVPLMTVEILSGSESIDEVDSKVEAYLREGVRLVWVLNPRSRTLTAYRPDAAPQFFSGEQTVDAEPVLKDFVVPLPKLFER